MEYTLIIIHLCFRVPHELVTRLIFRDVRTYYCHYAANGTCLYNNITFNKKCERVVFTRHVLGPITVNFVILYYSIINS